MKKIYFICIPALLLFFPSCKKDKSTVVPVESLLSGKTWELYSYNSPTYTNSQGFLEGTIFFTGSGGGGGEAWYTDLNGQQFRGGWAHYYDSQTKVHSLLIRLYSLTTSEEKSEFFDKIEFTNNTHFIGYVYSGYGENFFKYREKR